jgi:CheY-like chemotaxis protein
VPNDETDTEGLGLRAPSGRGVSLTTDTEATKVGLTTSLRILVVDDSEDIRDVLVRLVERLGHTAHTAADGVEAVELLKVESYDFMLLDLTMPRMSGEEVVRWLAEHPDRAVGLRVVIVSAWAGERRAHLQELGVYAVLPKPLRAQQLRTLLEEPRADARS